MWSADMFNFLKNSTMSQKQSSTQILSYLILIVYILRDHI